MQLNQSLAFDVKTHDSPELFPQLKNSAAVTVTEMLPSVAGYCAGLGANPGFRGPPMVEQVTLTSVRVSWAGLVTRKECADQFIVKSWLARNPNNYQMSSLLPTTQFSFVVRDLVPNQDYVFQVIFPRVLLTVFAQLSSES